MRRILLVLSVTAVMVLLLVAMAMPALAFHQNPNAENHPLVSGECGNQGKCTGFGDEGDNPGEERHGDFGDQRNNRCFEHGVCIGTNNN